MSEIRPKFKLLPYQKLVLQDTTRNIMITGGIGSGKSVIGLLKAFYVALTYPDSQVCLATFTYGMLRDILYLPFLQLIEGMDKNLLQVRSGDQYIKFFNGSTVIFKNLQEESRIRGLNLNFMFVDEGTVCLTDKMFRQVQGRIRNPGFQQLLIATNSGPPTHPLYRYFYDQSHINPDLKKTYTVSSYENLFLPSDYLRDLDAQPDSWKDQFVYGKWGSIQGRIYPYNPDIHKTLPHLLPRDLEYYLAIDWGYVNPACVLLLGRDSDWNVYVIDEIYVKQKTVEELSHMIQDRFSTYKLKGFVADSAEPGSIKMMAQRLQIPATPAMKSIKMGIMTTMKKFIKQGNGKPGILICPQCENLISEFYQYEWAGVSDDNVTVKEVPNDKSPDHACDALRYGVMSFFNTERKSRVLASFS